MRSEIPNKIIALVLDVHEKKVPQAFDPTRLKYARLFRVDAQAALKLLMQDAEELPPMTPDELEARRLMQVNRLDRSALHPRS